MRVFLVFFFLLYQPPLSVQTINTLARQKVGGGPGKWEAGTNPQVLSAPPLSPLSYVNEDKR